MNYASRVILLALLTSQVAFAQSARFEITTDESFDAESIPAYSGDHEAIYRYIDDHHGEHLENLKRWLRQPSVSAQNLGIEEMANMLLEDLKKLGFEETALVPTDGHPGVWVTTMPAPRRR